MASRYLFLIGIALLLSGAVAGCMSASIGTISFENGNLFITATNDGQPVQAVLQVTISEIRDFTQTEIYKKADFIQFASGTRQYQIPVDLTPGSYKVYVYIIVDGDSKARVVRDLVV